MVSRSPARGHVEAIGLRIKPQLKTALRLAVAENRTLSSYVEMALERHVAVAKPNSRKKRRI
jgi:hypothetical protein